MPQIFEFGDLPTDPEPIHDLKWRYNRYGHIELWNLCRPEPLSREADLHIKGESNIKTFFETINVNIKTIKIGDYNTAVDPGYF